MFKTAIGDVVQIPVKFTLKDASVNKLFSFTLTANRKSQDQMDEQPEKTVKDFLFDTITDWSGQRLVLLQNNEPAPFSRDAIEFAFAKYPSLEGIFWAAYLRESGCKEKN